MKYGVVFEPGSDGSVSAYAPDLPGVGVVGETKADALALITKAIAWQIEALVQDGRPLPPASSPERFECAVEIS